jgi:hypothetical protein
MRGKAAMARLRNSAPSLLAQSLSATVGARKPRFQQVHKKEATSPGRFSTAHFLNHRAEAKSALPPESA